MPRILLAAGAVLLAAAVVVALLLQRGSSQRATSVTVSVPARTTTTAPETTTTTPPLPPPSAPFSWDGAGVILWHPTQVDPEQLGATLRTSGFDWIAVYLGGPGDPATPDAGWLYRVKLTSGLPVGGWSVLGEDPATDAAHAADAVRQYNLAFYIADAEAPLGFTQGVNRSDAGYARSHAFADAFRASEPSLPAGVSSYCRPDQHDLDWSAWANAGFVFLPQAYVNDFGSKVAPATCVYGAAKWFASSNVHPTVGSYAGARGIVSPSTWVHLLAQAHTKGFSIYPAEVGMNAQSWQTYANAITKLGIANRP